MISIIPALFIFFWVIMAGSLLLDRKKSTVRRQLNLVHYFGYSQVSDQAKDAGWNITTKEFLAIVLFAIGIGLVLALIFKNPLIIVAGVVAGYYLPRFIVQRYKKRERMALMVAIPDFARILIARLVDHHSIVKAFEMTQKDCFEPMKTLAQEFVKDVGVGIGVQLALENLKVKVSYRKFNTFIETLLLAHQEGYSTEALAAMKKAVESIESDIKAIEALQITTRKKKRELFSVVIASWLFPVVLSFMNTDNTNIFLDTFSGKVLIFLYIISTMVVLIKGEDYLSLKLEEL
ncbi:type II secretion system F family protein [Thermincola ferriacetica]